MPRTTKQTMDKDLVQRLTVAGEEAVQKLGDLPGGKALLETAQSFRERLDDLGSRIRAIDPLEKRVTELEQRLSALEKKPARKQAPAKPKPKSGPGS
jgi:polyhydroxyalkanoate synthesis regulator phasin